VITLPRVLILICARSASKAPWFVFKNFPDYVVHLTLAYALKSINHIANTKTSTQAEDTLCPNQVYSGCAYGYCNEKYKNCDNRISKYLQRTITIKGNLGKLPFIKETKRLKLHR